ncbi:MAG: hypothetical protein IKP19_02670 [Oscillospiraceae bacterium]|nr:hypothetical protein [Oscillospiraceae bacterium]
MAFFCRFGIGIDVGGIRKGQKKRAGGTFFQPRENPSHSAKKQENASRRSLVFSARYSAMKKALFVYQTKAITGYRHNSANTP